MRTVARLASLAGLLVVAAIAAPAWGQCPGGMCFPPPSSFQPYHQPIYQPIYQPSPVFVQPHFQPAPAPVFVRPAEPAEPEKPVKAEPVVKNFGLDSGKIGDERRYVLNGKEVSRATAVEAIADVPDDSRKFHVVVLGAESERRRVTDALPLGADRERVIVHSWAADSPLVAQRKFVVESPVTVYVLAPDGRVLGRSRGGVYPGGEKAAQAISRAISGFDASKPRTPGPYDPSKDADLFAEPKPPAPPPNPDPAPKPGPSPGPNPAPSPSPPGSVPPWVYILGTAVVVLLVKKEN